MNELLKNLKEGKFSNIYLFHGKEDYLKEFYIKEIINSVVNDSLKEMNYDLFEDDCKEIDKIKEKITTFPFMSEKRIVHIKNCKITGVKNKNISEQLMKVFEDIANTTIVIIEEDEIDKRSKFYKTISKSDVSEVYECSKLDENTLTRWIQKKLKEKEKSVDSKVALYIIRKVGTDMRKIYTELQKLADYVEEKNVIRLEDVDVICSESVESKIFELLNEIGRKNLAKAIRIYKNLIMSKEPVQMIIYMIARQFIMINQTKMLIAKGTSQSEIGKMIGIQPFVVRECSRQAEKYSNKAIKDILNEILNLDVDIKKGKIDPVVGLELFILKAARQ